MRTGPRDAAPTLAIAALLGAFGLTGLGAVGLGCMAADPSPEPTKVEEAGKPGMATLPTTPPSTTQTDEPAPKSLAVPSCAEGPPIDVKHRLGLPEGEEAKDDGEGFFATKGAPPPPRAGAGADLVLSLAAKTSVAAGQPLGLAATFANRSAKPLTLMRSLDGSDAHWRFPVYDLYAKDERGRTYRWARTGGRCGMVNPITPEDFFTVAPGAKEPAPTDWASYAEAMLPEGRYELWLVYTMCRGSRKNGEDDEGAIAKRGVKTGRWASNAVTLDVSAAAPGKP